MEIQLKFTAIALAICFASPSHSLAADQSCQEKIKTASTRLVFTAKDGNKYHLGPAVKDAKPADPAKLCQKSSLAPMEKKLCHSTFTELRKSSAAYLKKLGEICQSLNKAPDCARADHACAQATTERGLKAQEEMLGLLKKFETSKLEKSVGEIGKAYQETFKSLADLLQKREPERKNPKPAPPKPNAITADVLMKNLGVKQLEQGWALLSTRPAATSAGASPQPDGPLIKELLNVRAVAEHLKRGFIEPEMRDRKEAAGDLQRQFVANRSRNRDGSTITGGGKTASGPQGRTTQSTAKGGGDPMAAAQQALAAASSLAKASGAGASSSSPQQSLRPSSVASTPASTLGGSAPGVSNTGGVLGSEASPLRRGSEGSLIALTAQGLTGSNDGTGAIRRGENNPGGKGNAPGSVGGGRIDGGSALESTVKDAILASRSGGAGSASELEGGKSSGSADAKSEEGLSFADLKARLAAAVDSFHTAVGPEGSLANFFGGGESNGRGSSSSAAYSSSSRSSPPAQAVKSLEEAPLQSEGRAHRVLASMPEPKFPESDSGDFQPTADIYESAMRDGAATFAADTNVQEYTLFERVKSKLQEKMELESEI